MKNEPKILCHTCKVLSRYSSAVILAIIKTNGIYKCRGYCLEHQWVYTNSNSEEKKILTREEYEIARILNE